MKLINAKMRTENFNFFSEQLIFAHYNTIMIWIKVKITSSKHC